MSRKRTTEDYLKTIYKLNLQGETPVRGISIAAELGVSKPTVSGILKRLVADGYITMDDEHRVSLTDPGRQIAVSTLERYNTLSKLLTKIGVSEEVADSDACKMEHNVSPESFSALKKLLSLWESVSCKGPATPKPTKTGEPHE